MENLNSILDAPEKRQHLRYAGFWERFAAAFIDGLLIWIINVILFSAIGYGSLAVLGAENDDAFVAGYALGLISIPIIMNWLYFAYFESGERQATLGKRALDLYVVDVNGGQITFGQASGRFFGKFVSSLCLLIGYLIQPFTEKKQALHDLMAGTLVVKRRGWGA